MGFNSNTINFKAGLDTSRVATGVQKIQGHMSSLSRSVNSIQRTFGGLGFAIAGAFSLQQIGRFAEESVNLALAAEGVEKAFNRMAKQGDLEKLREATRNMVSDLELMRQANFAASVGIEMEDLAKTMAYVQRYASATGKEMSELMSDATLEMIRQTGLRLDNIGLSIDKVKERAKEIGFIPAMLEEMEKNSAKFGDATLTTAEKVQQLKANWQDAKKDFGESVVPAYMIGLKIMTDALDYWSARIKYGYGVSRAMIDDAKRAASDGVKFVSRLQGQGVPDLLIRAKLNEAITRTREQLSKAQESGLRTTIEETNEVVTLTEKLAALQDAYNKIVNPTAEGVNPTPKSEVPIKDQINNLKEFNKELSGLSQRGMSEMQVMSLDTSLAINQLNSNLSELPEKLDPIAHSFENLKAPMSDVQTRMQAMLDDMNKMIESFIEGAMVDLFSRLGEGLFGAARDVEDWGNKMMASFGGFLQQMGAMIMSYGFAMDAFKKAFQSPAVAIAAGAALIAIGAGIKATHENKMNGGAGMSSAGVPSQSFNDGYNFQSRIDGYDIVLVTDRNQRLMTRRG